jgi:NAD-dependent dihydropyrimidine dehydrogenase PreA subunit
MALQDSDMNIDLYYYTGTGNSLWTARTLAESLGHANIFSMSAIHQNIVGRRADAVGIIFPVHVWGLPHRVIDFVSAMAGDPTAYYFALAVNAGQVAATLLQLKKLMASRDMQLSSGFDLVMPSNYLPWGGPGPVVKQMKRIRDAREKIGKIAVTVVNRENRPVEKGPLWKNILFSWFNKITFPRIPGMDKSFWVDEKCDACRICKAVCPCDNIKTNADGKPIWNHQCEQCLACIQWCPREAIQFGKRTSRFERYHHPEVRLRDMLQRNDGHQN